MLSNKIISFEELRKKLSNQMRKNRDKSIREKVELFYLAAKLQNISEACARRGVTRDFFHRWWKRLKTGQFQIESLLERSRRPHQSPKQIPLDLEVRIKCLRRKLGLGPEMLAYYLKQEGVVISESTIGHVLRKRKRHTLKAKVRLKVHQKRYELPIPGQRLQMDVKYSPCLQDGQKTYTYVAIDECTRWRLARTFTSFGGIETVEFLNELKEKAPFPIQCIQTDNGSEFTNRLQPYEKRNPYRTSYHPVEVWMRSQKIYHRLIPPGEKELNGKVERSHRIDEEYFYWKAPLKYLASFNRALKRWIHRYNHERPHGGLKGMTPHQKIIERKLRLPYEPVEDRFLKAKEFYLRETKFLNHPGLVTLATLQAELTCYNAGIRGLNASGKS